MYISMYLLFRGLDWFLTIHQNKKKNRTAPLYTRIQKTQNKSECTNDWLNIRFLGIKPSQGATTLYDKTEPKIINT